MASRGIVLHTLTIALALLWDHWAAAPEGRMQKAIAKGAAEADDLLHQLLACRRPDRVVTKVQHATRVLRQGFLLFKYVNYDCFCFILPTAP